MPLDLYSTRAQLRAIELLPPEHNFLTDIFAGAGETVEDSAAVYDYRKGHRRMAPFVTDGAGGVLLDRDGFDTREIGFSRIAPERIVDSEIINKRSFGEDVLGAMTPEQRARKLYMKDMVDMRKAVHNRIEWMIRQLLTSGKEEIFEYTREGRNKHANLIADYGFTNHYTPANPWGASGAKIGYDLRKMVDIVQEGLGYVDVVVMDSDAAEAIAYDETFMKQLDVRNFDIGEFKMKYMGQGIRYLGTTSDGIDMYSCACKFTNDNGIVENLLPKGTVIAGGRGMLNLCYGPVTQVEGFGSSAQHKTYIKKEVPYRYGSEESNAVKNRLTSCPTVVPFNVDAWVVANVLSA